MKVLSVEHLKLLGNLYLTMWKATECRTTAWDKWSEISHLGSPEERTQNAQKTIQDVKSPLGVLDDQIAEDIRKFEELIRTLDPNILISDPNIIQFAHHLRDQGFEYYKRITQHQDHRA